MARGISMATKRRLSITARTLPFRRRWRQEAAMLRPSIVSPFHFFQLLALFRRKHRHHFIVRFLHHLMHLLTGVAADFFQLNGRLPNERFQPLRLLRRERELMLQTRHHALRHQIGGVPLMRMPSLRVPNPRARHAASQKDEQATKNQFPLQRRRHCGISV